MAVATQYATGRRKCAIARAWVTGRAGDITINDQPLEKAFPRLTLRQIIQFPLEIGGVVGQYSIKATVQGGGQVGQAGALRHAIARALVGAPRLLLADEPTGNLDPKTSEVIWDLFLRLQAERGLAVVIATHNHELARRADRGYRLVEGRAQAWP